MNRTELDPFRALRASIVTKDALRTEAGRDDRIRYQRHLYRQKPSTLRELTLETLKLSQINSTNPNAAVAMFRKSGRGQGVERGGIFVPSVDERSSILIPTGSCDEGLWRPGLVGIAQAAAKACLSTSRASDTGIWVVKLDRDPLTGVRSDRRDTEREVEALKAFDFRERPASDIVRDSVNSMQASLRSYWLAKPDYTTLWLPHEGVEELNDIYDRRIASELEALDAKIFDLGITLFGSAVLSSVREVLGAIRRIDGHIGPDGVSAGVEFKDSVDR